MITGTIYNNIGIEALAISFILQRIYPLPITKVLLIPPIISHKGLVNYLSNGNVKIQSLEKLMIEKTSFFSNFNRRFYDNLCGSINTIQFLHEIEFICISNGNVYIKKAIEYDESMGKRAERIYKASDNVSILLLESSENLYLNLRVEL